MTVIKKLTFAFTLSLLAFTFAASPASAKGGDEYGKVVRHLKTKYSAKKVKIPFMWLARMAVGVVRPAGVKSFNVTLFNGLQFSRATLDAEMNAALKDSLGPEWSPIMRVRSHEGQQVYMNLKESGDSIKLMLVTIDKDGAAVIRARFSPEKLAEFINDPKIFGISLSSDEKKTNVTVTEEPEKSAPVEEAKKPE